MAELCCVVENDSEQLISCLYHLRASVIKMSMIKTLQAIKMMLPLLFICEKCYVLKI